MEFNDVVDIALRFSIKPLMYERCHFCSLSGTCTHFMLEATYHPRDLSSSCKNFRAN